MRYIVNKKGIVHKTGIGISIFDFATYACLAMSAENGPKLESVHDFVDIPQGLNLVFYDAESLDILINELRLLKRQFETRLKEWEEELE